MYSYSIWQNKPLIRLSYDEIDQIIIVNDKGVKYKNPNIKIVFQLCIKIKSGYLK